MLLRQVLFFRLFDVRSVRPGFLSRCNTAGTLTLVNTAGTLTQQGCLGVQNRKQASKQQFTGSQHLQFTSVTQHTGRSRSNRHLSVEPRSAHHRRTRSAHHRREADRRLHRQHQHITTAFISPHTQSTQPGLSPLPPRFSPRLQRPLRGSLFFDPSQSSHRQRGLNPLSQQPHQQVT